MDRSAFRSEFQRMAEANGVHLVHKVDAIADIAAQHEGSTAFANIFAGSTKNTFLLVTSGATYALRMTLFGGTHVDWVVDHAELTSPAWHRRSKANGYVLDELVLPRRGGTDSFWFGFNDPRGAASASRDIVKHNCEVAAQQVNDASGDRGGEPSGGLVFDPQGPEEAAGAAKEAYLHGDFLEAFKCSVVAVDRLHDFYVFEQFRNRQPSPADAWIVNGLTSALGAARACDNRADVRENVRTATHRLRTIATAIEQAGGNSVLFRAALDRLSADAPDVDVSDIFWS